MGHCLIRPGKKYICAEMVHETLQATIILAQDQKKLRSQIVHCSI